MPNITDKLSIEANSVDPEQTAPGSTLFAIEASLTFQQTRKAGDFCCDWRIKEGLTLCLLAFCRLQFFFIYIKSTFSKEIVQEVQNSLDPDQAVRFVGSDLGPNCLQSLSADGTSRLRETLQIC